MVLGVIFLFLWKCTLALIFLSADCKLIISSKLLTQVTIFVLSSKQTKYSQFPNCLLVLQTPGSFRPYSAHVLREVEQGGGRRRKHVSSRISEKSTSKKTSMETLVTSLKCWLHVGPRGLSCLLQSYKGIYEHGSTIEIPTVQATRWDQSTRKRTWGGPSLVRKWQGTHFSFCFNFDAISDLWQKFVFMQKGKERKDQISEVQFLSVCGST